jgi:cysteinyl-tRNA synthetase
VLAALCDDLNTPEALAALAGIATEARRTGDPTRQGRLKSQLLAGGALLGLLQQAPEAWFQAGGGEDAGAIEALVQERIAARAGRDFARADAIRDQLAAIGVAIEDGADGARWRWNR